MKREAAFKDWLCGMGAWGIAMKVDENGKLCAYALDDEGRFTDEKVIDDMAWIAGLGWIGDDFDAARGSNVLPLDWSEGPPGGIREDDWPENVEVGVWSDKYEHIPTRRLLWRGTLKLIKGQLHILFEDMEPKTLKRNQ